MVRGTSTADLTRPYLVIPKLIEQPTWGGSYIVGTKNWSARPALKDRKIGQSYELFSGSNLSLASSSEDASFEAELTDRDAVQVSTDLPNAIPLTSLIQSSAEAVLGLKRVAKKGTELNLLIKFTQALGNSFQLHIKDGVKHPRWKAKPESWYYLEPGIITLGVRPNVNWQTYQSAVTMLAQKIAELGHRLALGSSTYEDTQKEIQKLLNQYDPWQFVNVYETKKDELIDPSAGGIHHSWEEDPKRFPLGNVLYELQAEAMDDVSTIRNFDKGKISPDGSARDIHIEDYFTVIDRSPKANDPQNHLRQPEILENTDTYQLEKLMSTRHYTLHKLTLTGLAAVYRESINEYRHIFVKSGAARISAPGGEVYVTTGHSCFVPAKARDYSVQNVANTTELLISFN